MATIPFGSRFGKWVVIGQRDAQGRYLCACECGAQKLVQGGNLRNGMSKSCGGAGCRDPRRISHGRSRTPLYKVWAAMRERCESPKSTSYPNYGARGITVCAEWTSFDAFAAWADANGYRLGLEIDRIDNNGHYAPENCRWVTPTQNSRNKRNTRKLAAFGEEKPRSEWVTDPRCKVQYSTLVYRLNKGWEPERAMTEPENVTILQQVTAFGETKHLREWSRDPRCVVTYKTLHARIRRQGYEPEMAMTTPEITREVYTAQGKGNSRRVTAFGETKSVEEWARDPRCSVSAVSVWTRIFKKGLDPEIAITTPRTKRGELRSPNQ